MSEYRKPPLFTYHAFGLNIASDLECPELLAGNGAAPDVRVRSDSTPVGLDSPQAQGAAYQVASGQFLLTIEHVARFFVRHGNEIVIERAPEATDGDIRSFLLGSVIGVLLHQRGVLPLHASAIETARGVVAFAGEVGLGKSTLAAAFHRRGYRVLTDDVCAVSLDTQSKPLVTPAYPQLNLCADALEHIGEAKEDQHRTRSLTEKYGRPVKAGFSIQPAPLHAVYELHTTDNGHPSLTHVTGREKMWLLRDNTFRLAFRAGMGDDERYLRLALAVAQHIRAARISRPSESFLLDELVNLLENDLGV